MVQNGPDRKQLHPLAASRRFFQFYLWYPQQMLRFAPIRLVLLTLLMVSKSLIQPGAFLLILVGVTTYLNPQQEPTGMQLTALKILNYLEIPEGSLGVVLICAACAMLIVFAICFRFLLQRSYNFVRYCILKIIEERSARIVNHPGLSEKSKRQRLNYLYSKAPMTISLNSHLWIDGLGSIVTSIIVVCIMLVSNFWFTTCLFAILLPLSLLLIPDVRRLKESVIFMRKAKKSIRRDCRALLQDNPGDGSFEGFGEMGRDDEYAGHVYDVGARRQNRKTMNASLEIIKAVAISVGILAVLISSHYTSISVSESLTLVVLMRTFILSSLGVVSFSANFAKRFGQTIKLRENLIIGL